MTLAALKAILTVTTGTSFGEVIMDSDLYFNTKRDKTYPFVLWQLDRASFKKDARSTTVQKTRIITLTAFAIIRFDPNTQNRVTIWDTVEGYFDTYINRMNTSSSIQILNIDDIEGVYLHEGEQSHDKEIGIMYPNIKIKMFC